MRNPVAPGRTYPVLYTGIVVGYAKALSATRVQFTYDRDLGESEIKRFSAIFGDGAGLTGLFEPYHDDPKSKQSGETARGSIYLWLR